MNKIDTSSLSYAYIDAQPIDIDWTAARGEDGDGLTIHLPEITAAVLADYGAGHEPEEFDAAAWLEDNVLDYLSAERIEELTAAFSLEDSTELAEAIAAHDAWKDCTTFRAAADQVFNEDEATIIALRMEDDKAEHDEDALEQAVEEFRSSSAYYEWEEAFQPMMNALWPCEPRYGMTDEDAATAIDRYAGSTVLVTLNSEVHNGLQGIAMTGGGMDMSWDLCAAYICCGCIPPVRLLSSVPHFAGQRMAPMKQAVLECMDLAADWLEARAQRMRSYRAETEKHLTK